jgi:uncharacterized damage-inducible protein DinB
MTLQQSSEIILNQLSELLEKMNPVQYQSPVDSLSGSSIGSHVRHILEFYECLVKGVENGTVDYDSRSRIRLLETDVEFALTVLKKIIGTINSIQSDLKLNLKVDLSTGENPVTIHTTFNRELVYNIEHAIHHMAIIKIGVSLAYPALELDKNFGVAYSTIKYKTQLCAQ